MAGWNSGLWNDGNWNASTAIAADVAGFAKLTVIAGLDTLTRNLTVGTTVLVQADFTTLTGAVVDPTTVTFRTVTPAGVTADYVYLTDDEVERISEGVYRLSFVPSTQGVWVAQVDGSGQCSVVTRRDIPVRLAY